jgi:hypothetical protein
VAGRTLHAEFDIVEMATQELAGINAALLVEKALARLAEE